MANGPAFIRWFGDIGLNDVSLVGGKNASLGELYRELSRVGVRVPNGFAIAAEGYRHFMHVTGLAGTIDSLTKGLQPSDLAALAERGLAIRQAVLGTALPDDLQAAVTDAYQRLGEGAPIDVAVRSSATAEDLPDASFAAVTASG